MRGVERNHTRVVLPFLLKLTLLMHHLLPRPVEWLVIKTGWKRSHGQAADDALLMEQAGSRSN